MAEPEDHDEGEPNARGGATDAPPTFRRPPLLPKDLEGSLRHLDEDELARLRTAVTAEHERRGLARSDAGHTVKGSGDVVRKTEPTSIAPSIEGLTLAQVNLVQAAFKAGVKPSAIARQFGISPKLIQKVLAKKGR